MNIGTALVLLATLGEAQAQSCPAAIRVDGDPDLVDQVRHELERRGIDTSPEADCPSLHVTIVRRGIQIAVVVESTGETTERLVSEASTAATVIESFTRTDVTTPLLATRATSAGIATRLPSTPPTPTTPVAQQGVHLAVTASFESSLASDRTTWLGYNLKLCIELGPICAAARLRSNKVLSGLDGADIAREHSELLIGVDVPLALGRFQLSPGFAGGVGRMETNTSGMKRETGGFVVETHVSLSIPVASQIALATSLSAVLGDYDTAAVMAPTEPSFFLLASLGLTYRR